MSAARAHRRPDGTCDIGAMQRGLGLARPTVVNRLERLMSGHYGPAPSFPPAVPKPAKVAHIVPASAGSEPVVVPPASAAMVTLQ